MSWFSREPRKQPLPGRRNFLRALVGAPVAAVAIERIIAAGGPAAPKVEPVKPAPEPKWEKAVPWPSWDGRYAVSGVCMSDFHFTGCCFSGTYIHRPHVEGL